MDVDVHCTTLRNWINRNSKHENENSYIKTHWWNARMCVFTAAAAAAAVMIKPDNQIVLDQACFPVSKCTWLIILARNPRPRGTSQSPVFYNKVLNVKLYNAIEKCGPYYKSQKLSSNHLIWCSKTKVCVCAQYKNDLKKKPFGCKPVYNEALIVWFHRMYYKWINGIIMSGAKRNFGPFTILDGIYQTS